MAQAQRSSEGGAIRHAQRRPTALPLEGLFMNRIVALSAPLLTLGLFFAPDAHAEDTMMKKDSLHMKHHMKKDAMMHKDTMMKKDPMKDDAAQK